MRCTPPTILPLPRAALDPLSEHFANAADGTRLFYEVSGDGPVVVLCDGIACDGFVWKYLHPFLLRAFRVLHWHYRGHGRSGPPRDRDRIDLSAHASDLHAVLDHAGVSRAALLGHSMGTQVCLESWHQRPDRIAAMGLVCGSSGRITRTFHNTELLVHALPKAIELYREHPRIARALWSRGPVGVMVQMARLLDEVDRERLDPKDLAPYFDHVNLLDPEMFLRMLLAAGEHDAGPFLTEITAPTLVVAAERDTFTPMFCAEEMARKIPRAELLVVPRGSHSAPLEQPHLINARIDEFLRGVFGVPAAIASV